MDIARIRVIPAPPSSGRPSNVLAFVTVTFRGNVVVKGIKIIDGRDGPFLAMPRRKLAEPCPSCRRRCDFDAKFCQGCGQVVSFAPPPGSGAEHRVTRNARDYLTRAVLEKWERVGGPTAPAEFAPADHGRI